MRREYVLMGFLGMRVIIDSNLAGISRICSREQVRDYASLIYQQGRRLHAAETNSCVTPIEPAQTPSRQAIRSVWMTAPTRGSSIKLDTYI